MNEEIKEAEPKKSGFGAKVFGLLRTLRGKLVSVFTSPTQKNAQKISEQQSVEEMRENQRANSRRKRKAEEYSEEESVVLRKRRKSSEVRPPDLQLHSKASDDILKANQARRGKKRKRSGEEDSEAERVKRFKGDKTGSEERQCPDETKAGGVAGPVSIDRFIITRELGSGSFGTVSLARDKVTGQRVAIKTIAKKTAYPSLVMSERRILEAAQDCPYLVHSYAAFQSEEEIFFIMEYIPGGTLQDLLEGRGALDIGTARNLAAEIVCGLTFLHSRGIIHRDLKPENILIDSAGLIRIADFGLAVEGVFGDETTAGYAGTKGYMAPEISNGGKYDSTVDYWSLGVILHEMLTGRKPAFSWWTNNFKCPQNLSPEEKDILMMLLCNDPIKRHDFVHCIKDHPFFESTDWLALEGASRRRE
ncbi:protein kinase C delta type [Xenopus laevis]|uniref:Protein kinase C delta type n=1 Tax=Xenopus laevis TaxID=8355 RepID=A0A8J1KM08_XENLA|nr:protein kinase C delta type [Xenopus laevis]